MTPVKIKIKPGESQLVYVVTDNAAFSVKRYDGKYAIVVLSRGEWSIEIAEGSTPPTVHVTKALI